MFDATHDSVAPISIAHQSNQSWLFLHIISRPLSANGPNDLPGYLGVFICVDVVTQAGIYKYYVVVEFRKFADLRCRIARGEGRKILVRDE